MVTICKEAWTSWESRTIQGMFMGVLVGLAGAGTCLRPRLLLGADAPGSAGSCTTACLCAWCFRSSGCFPPLPPELLLTHPRDSWKGAL